LHVLIQVLNPENKSFWAISGTPDRTSTYAIFKERSANALDLYNRMAAGEVNRGTKKSGMGVPPMLGRAGLRRDRTR
jgi:hypothetical protein